MDRKTYGELNELQKSQLIAGGFDPTTLLDSDDTEEIEKDAWVSLKEEILDPLFHDYHENIGLERSTTDKN